MKLHYRRNLTNIPIVTILLLGCSLNPLLYAEAINPLESLLPESCLLLGKFSQRKQLADIPKPLDSTGQFIFNCNQGLLWLTETPHLETLVYRRDNKHYLLAGDSSEREKVERLKGRVHRELGKILNNLIGADLDYLEKHFDHSANQDELSQESTPPQTLIPKNKRLRNYIASITLSRTDSGTLIDIQQGEDEAMQIRIFAAHSLSVLEAETCAQHLPTQAQACQLLFQ